MIAVKSALAAEAYLVPSAGWWDRDERALAAGSAATGSLSVYGYLWGGGVPALRSSLIEHRGQQKVCLITAKQWDFMI